MAKKKASKLRIVKTAPRRFREDELLAPAEYQIQRDGQPLGIIIKAQDGWRVCRATTESLIGAAISPVGLDAFRKVRAWAIEHFTKSGGAIFRTLRQNALIAV